MIKKIKHTEIQLIKGDITEMSVDAIVNAANAQLILGGGVAGAIRKKGGPEIQKECDAIGGTFVGGAEITTAGNLKAKFVIHAVGPRMGEGDEDDKLKNATRNSLLLADKHGLQSIAFPAISTGIFGFPADRCADLMLRASSDYIKNEESTLRQILFCLWGDDIYEIFRITLERY
ncbi:MAG: macro domain-containing protein [candidate division KSB1 bacterium]|jgi:O-acetyl-ADP-ribose deacetylase (regulator of RNase III)|nr:macro domain-containing protein [candidate division KSB1 bacterium]